MRVPSAEELAAIALAYVAVARPRPPAAQTVHASRWALAGRLRLDHDAARVVAARANRWSLAGRRTG